MAPPSLETAIDSDIPINNSDSKAVSTSDVDELAVSSHLAQSLFRQGFALGSSEWISKSKALRWAVENDHAELVQQLLDQGADVNLASGDGWTCLHLAASCDVLEMLLTYGADMAARCGKYGLTPLHWATVDQNLGAVQLLVSRGADSSARGRDGRFPLHIAAIEGFVEAIQVMLDANANVVCEDDRNYTPLHFACREGHLDAARLLIDHAAERGRCHVVKQLLSSGADPRAVDEDGMTVLHLAVLGNSLATAQTLLDQSIDIESRDRYGATALVAAVLHNRAELASLLLSQGANAEAATNAGETPLHLAVIYNERQMMELLIDKGANVEARDKNDQTPLLAATAAGNIEAAYLLVQLGADVKVTSEGLNGIHLAVMAQSKPLIRFFAKQHVPIDAKLESTGSTPLIQAATKGNPEIVSLLIRLGADVNAADKDGWTALHRAAEHGQKQIVEILLENAADPEAETAEGMRPHHVSNDQGRGSITEILNKSIPDTPAARQESDARSVAALFRAVESGHLARVVQLLEEGVDVDLLDMDGRSPLSLAAEHGWTNIVLALINRSASLDLKDAYGGSPLWWASRYGHDNIVEHLLEHGAYIDTLDMDGQSPLSISTQHRHASTVKMLLTYGAYPNSATDYGKTALLFAVSAGQLDIVELLVESGADINYKSPQGDTALSLAERHGCSKLLNVIRAGTRRSRTGINEESSNLTPANHERYCSMLIDASRRGHLKMIERLKGLGVDPGRIINGRTALHEAAFRDQAKAVALLVKYGAITDLRDAYGCTALILAASQGHVRIVEILCGLGASLENVNNEGRGPLLEAAREGHDTTTSLLLRYGARTESRDSKGGGPLWHATSNGHKNIVKMLVEHGANLESADHGSCTPLMVAVRNKDRILAKFLLENGAQMRPETSHNYSPLCSAANNGDEAIVDLLLEYGADLNYASDGKRSALHIATLGGNAMVVKMLIEAGADVDSKDDDGRTALSLAKERSLDSVTKLLWQSGSLRHASGRATRKANEERLNKRASYHYQPLKEQGSIRVLELHPGNPGDIISFGLTEVLLAVHPAFEALSYEWRDKVGSVPVQCDNNQILVTPNCKAAMEHLRLRLRPRYLWIDAICVNQEDIQERNQQVAMMTEIYRLAGKVHMWLGEETASARLAFEVLPVMAKAHDLIHQADRGLPLTPQSVEEESDALELMESVLRDKQVFEALWDLTKRTYWTRAWIVQEIIMGGSRVISSWGSQSCPWATMQAALLAFDLYPSTPHSPVFHTSRLQEKLLDNGRISLCLAVWELLTLAATDPRDKIFAALGLASTDEKLVERPVADYTMTVQQVYVHTTRYIIDMHGISPAWQFGIRHKTKKVPGLPSWVPDFERLPDSRLVDLERISSFMDENPFDDSALLYEPNIAEQAITTETSLWIGGCIMDRIVFKLTMTKDLDPYQTLSSAFCALATQNINIYDTYPAHRGFQAYNDKTDTAESEEDEYSARTTTNAMALFTTIMDIEKVLADENKTINADQLHSMLIGFLTWSISEDKDIPRQMKHVPEYARQAMQIWFDQFDNSQGFHDFELQNLALIEDTLRYNMDLVYTEHGYFGVTNGGEAEEGMSVAVVGNDNELRLMRNRDSPEEIYEYVDKVFLNFLHQKIGNLEEAFGEIEIRRLELR
ncbi:hypothetical protein F66182_1497 [Fusarium sp. NRRL 66182]|nr:hypothetical protein F66182_1497 [Fusarium sp. NRRL 66182]